MRALPMCSIALFFQLACSTVEPSGTSPLPTSDAAPPLGPLDASVSPPSQRADAASDAMATPAQTPLAPRADTRAARLRQTLEELAAFGEKRAGTPAGQKAAQYVAARLEGANLQVSREPFQFPSFELTRSSLRAALGDTPTALEHAVFAYSGSGSFDAPLVCAGGGTEFDFALTDPRGKVVLVERNPTFHRTAQYEAIVERGGVAMLYVSAAVDDLIQVGTVRYAYQGLGTIPALTVPRSVGQQLIAACSSGLRVAGEVEARVEPRTATNVIATRPGARADAPIVVVGAHFDSWHVGSADNGAGVAALLELADATEALGDTRLSTVFVAYDAEEIGLLGGYDFLRKHVVRDHDPVVAYLHFEGPAVSPNGGNKYLTYTNGAGMLDSIDATGSRSLYPLTIGLELVPAVLGGGVPTDIQGLYRHGIQGIATTCDTPYYHTTADTPDKIDVAALESVVEHFAALRADLDTRIVATPLARDPALWNLRLTPSTEDAGLLVAVHVEDGAHSARSGAEVEAWLGVDDFTEVFRGSVRSDAAGNARLLVPSSALGAGAGSRFLHVTAGDGYPLAEQILALP